MRGLYEVFYAGQIFLNVISAAIVIYVILSWLQPRFKAYFMLQRFIAPFVAPFRKLSIRLTRYFNVPLDFTCVLAVLFFRILGRVWWMLYTVLLRLMLR